MEKSAKVGSHEQKNVSVAPDGLSGKSAEHAFESQEQTTEDDDDSDVILVSIEKSSGRERPSGNMLLMQNELENMNLNSTMASENLRICRQTDFTCEQSATCIKNQIAKKKQNSPTNLFISTQRIETIAPTTNVGIPHSGLLNAVTAATCASSPTSNRVSSAFPSAKESSSKENEERQHLDIQQEDARSVLGNFESGTNVCEKKCDILSEIVSTNRKHLDRATYESSSKSDATKETATCSKLLHNPIITTKMHSLESRPIYPNVPYSPYASPYGSPRSNRRRPPLRESRRVSIEQSGSFLQLNQYKLMDQIGQGSYGLVKLAYSEEDSTHYAMKILSKRRLLRQAGLMRRGPKKATSPLDRVYREIAVLKKLDHPNVVKLVEVLDDPVEDSLYMVFELVKQGEVLSIPTDNPLSEERAWSVFRETLLGLEYLHYQRIIHGDLKPGNLLLTECGHVKIADLGVCNEFLGEDSTMNNGSTGGTPAFRAPESLNIGQNVYCGKAADIWALGITLYSLVYGNVPFVASSIPVLYEKIKTEPLMFSDNFKISDELKDCIKRMLTKDPTQRITLPQLKEHTWVTAGGAHPLPTEDENCCLVQVSDDDINSVVRSIPKLDTLILIKTMLKKHSFGNPFASGRSSQRGASRVERFVRAGRSNSAPGAYNLAIDRQHSSDNTLPSLSEHGPGYNEES